MLIQYTIGAIYIKAWFKMIAAMLLSMEGLRYNAKEITEFFHMLFFSPHCHFHISSSELQ